VEAGQLPPARGDGAPASSLVEVQEGAHIVHALSGKPETKVLVATTGGYGFLSTVGDMISNRKAGREFMSVDEGHVPIQPYRYEDAKGNFVATLSENGRLLLFAIEEVKYQPKGRGTILMGLDEEDKLFAAVIHDKPHLVVSGKIRGGREKEFVFRDDKLNHYYLKRARMGRVVSGMSIATGLVAGG
jgi:topoisomerase-4 subunit A